jgi:hypothetical protein
MTLMLQVLASLRQVRMHLLCWVPVLALEAYGAAGVEFTNVTAQAGIRFTHHSGATGKKYLPESLGAGCAFVDLDNDGWADILLMNGKDWTPSGKHYYPALYRNNHNGTFTDITAGSGLDKEMYGLGTAVGDYDNDGLPDVYITALDGDHLFRNLGHGHFADVTATSGIRNADFGTSAAWFDYDRDGKLDLLVANYVQWTPATDIHCSMDGKTKSYCTPEAYKGRSLKLFHNLGNGQFADVTAKAGMADPTSKSLGITVFDVDNDGWPDVFVANDTQPNKLYRNNRDGTFREEAVPAGVAYSEDGTARGGMGTDAADLDHNGRFDLVVGNFSNQMIALYRNSGSGLFTDVAPNSPVGRASLLSLTFGTFFFDYDLDGYQDLFAANGHLEPDIQKFQPNIRYKQPPLLFRNKGAGKFEDVSNSVGRDFTVPIAGRGAAYADFDHDGDLDVLIATNNGEPELLRNDGGNQNHWLTVRLVGTKSNRSGIGAVVHVESEVGRQSQRVHSGSSYCSQSELALTFGLGQQKDAARITVEWPSGQSQTFTNVPADRFVNIDESRGILR